MTWRPLLRLAHREARRARGRSALIVLMVMLPVAAVTFADVLVRTASIDDRERVGILLGRTADARLTAETGGRAILQEPDALWASMTVPTADGAEEASDAPPVDPRRLLPPGSRWITDASTDVTARTTDGLARAAFRELDYTDPLAEGTVTQLAGRPPRSEDEVVVTPSLLRTLGLAVGDRVELREPRRTLLIVGTYRYLGDDIGPATFIGRPGTVIDAAAGNAGEPAYRPVSYLVDTPAPLTWRDVLRLNERGVAAFSRHVVEHPPARSEVPLYAQPGLGDAGGRVDVAAYAAAGLVVVLAVLEVALLAGAAFAVGARRQSRALGLVAAAGGTKRQVGGVVLAQGLVLGAAGGVIGVGLGLPAALVAIPAANRWLETPVPPADVRPLELAALVLLGVVTGLIAAVLPARTAGRQDVLASLRGRRGITRGSRRLPAAGLAAAAVGSVVSGAGAAVASRVADDDVATSDGLRLVFVLAILVGAALTLLGLVVASPAVVGAAARLGRRLPVAPRLAVRDAARHRGRSAPAVAAILAAVAGSVALTVVVSSLSDRDRRHYQPALGYGQYAVSARQPPPQSGLPPVDVRAKLAAIARVAPPDRTFPVDTVVVADCAPGAATCRWVRAATPPANACPTERAAPAGGGTSPPTPAEREPAADASGPPPQHLRRAAADDRCSTDAQVGFSSSLSGPAVGGYREFTGLTGLRSDEARRALEAGGIVVFDPLQVHDGRGVLEVAEQAPDATEPPSLRLVEVPAAYVDPRGTRFLDSFVSRAAAAAAGVQPVRDAIIVEYRTPPDDDTEERVRDELDRLGEPAWFQVERGYRDRYGVGLLALLVASGVVTLGAAGVATGLAQADARADHATLAAIGSAPRLRRSLAAWQSAVVAGLGAVLGTVAGVVPAGAFILADAELQLVVPWRNLVAIALVVPAVAAAGSWALTGSRLPLTRRIEA